MPKATSVPSTPPETAPATPPPTRRRALAALGWTGTAALSGAALGHSLADAAEAMTPSPDATLIRICADRIAILDAIAGHEDMADDDPLWSAYDRSSDAISEAKATTLEGLIAKARAAKRQAMTSAGTEVVDGMQANIAWDIVNDLVRLAAGRAA